MYHIDSLPTLYKRDDSGRIRTWEIQIGFNSDEHAGTRTVAGLIDGKQTTSVWNIKEAKNVGKKNGTTSRTQAMRDAQSAWDRKLERDFFKDIKDVDSYEKFKPMLAAGYKDHPTPHGFSQPKLDGIRCIADKNGLWTRAGKPITSCPHISEALKSYFDVWPTAILDGELYNHKLKADFNKITSLVRKTKSTEEDFKEAEKLVEYHMYDITWTHGVKMTFKNRNDILNKMAMLKSFKSDILKIVETTWCDNQEEMDKLYSEYTEDGYEGQMVRHDTPYEHKRSKGLLKRKEFTTEEFKVVEVLEGLGNWSGYVKRFICELPANADTPAGKTFGSGIRGSQQQMKELLESGKTPDWATVRYFNLTPDGVPRFPVVVDYGFGERDD